MSSSRPSPENQEQNSSQEHGVVERILKLISPGDGFQLGEVGPGDDAAVLSFPAGRQLVTCNDVAVMDVHLDSSHFSAFELGWRAMAATTSDLAAMGAEAWIGVVSAIGNTDSEILKMMEGVQACASSSGTVVVGGDVSSAHQASVSVTCIGTIDGPAMLRSEARAGDAIVITGPLGGSAAGLRLARSGNQDHRLVERHRFPQPLLAAGSVARACGVRAAIDISDGFSIDLARMAEASGVAARIDSLWIDDGATEVEALGGGEDYELIFATQDPDALIAQLHQDAGREARCVGVFLEGAGINYQGAPFEPLGYRHQL